MNGCVMNQLLMQSGYPASQVTQCYDSPPVQAGFFVGGIWQYGFQVY